jgi:hypothetical protein
MDAIAASFDCTKTEASLCLARSSCRGSLREARRILEVLGLIEPSDW